jgi:transcriptional regulator with XRE-family HTH domain
VFLFYLEEIDVALGARIKELRLKKGESLQKVADAVGASKAHIWEIETGKSRNPSMDLLTALANHFGTTVSHLVGEDPNAVGEDAGLVAMYRDLKQLSDHDRETIRGLMNVLKEKRKEGT